MKKISVLFVTVVMLGLSFASCNKDDDDNNSTSSSLEGKWNYSTVRIELPGLSGEELDYESANLSCGKDFVEFKPKGVADLGYYSDDCKVVTNATTWSQDGSKLTYDGDTYEIVINTDSLLKIKSTNSEGDIKVFTIITFIRG
jgi:hypothetical protein